MKDPIIDLPFFCHQFSSLELFSRINYISNAVNICSDFYAIKSIVNDFKTKFNQMRGEVTLHAIDTQHKTKVGIIDPSKEISIGEHFRKHFTNRYKHIEFGNDEIKLVGIPSELKPDSNASLEYSFEVNMFKYEISSFLIDLIYFLSKQISKKAIIFSKYHNDGEMFKFLCDLKDNYLKNMSALAIVSENPKLIDILKNIYVNNMFITGKEPVIQMSYDKFLYYKEPSLRYTKHHEDLYEEIKKHV